MSNETPATPPSGPSGRPSLPALLWWPLMVLVFYGIHTHQRLMEQTRLTFSVTLAGRDVPAEASVTWDGQPAFSGQRISLGSHTFSVSHPKGVPFTTNLFVWYGGRDFGTIDLKRTTGRIVVKANPPAPLLSISGPEWSISLTNSTGTDVVVPTDVYEVSARYAHWTDGGNVTVSANATASWIIAPQLGALKLSSDQQNATFQLLSPVGQLVEAGDIPSVISELPVGDYGIVATHDGHERDLTVSVKPSETTALPVDFNYGQLELETQPAGATVSNSRGRDIGITPLTLPETMPGHYKFTLYLPGYERMDVAADVSANKTVDIQTNLVSVGYVQSMAQARQLMAQSKYVDAAQAASDALAVRAGDADATALSRKATALAGLQRARALGQQEDYFGGERELAAAAQLLPDNQEIKDTLADFKTHEPEQIERLRLERLNRGHKVFDKAAGDLPDADLFETHELTTPMPVEDVRDAVVRELGKPPELAIATDSAPAPKTYEIGASQEFKTYMATSAGRRICLIVMSEVKDGQTQILYKVWEYKAVSTTRGTIGDLIGTPVAVKYVPIHPSRIEMTDRLRAQLEAGASNLTAKIEAAIK